ncbi:MAG: putative toxin-antitoxin system toxin component, PIN family [Wenzhouxiangellaceae bacterium]|nr:putative toxin-antitoxin system toxin component, PIN family [Wenzhouxiangellaceae bacterium]
MVFYLNIPLADPAARSYQIAYDIVYDMKERRIVLDTNVLIAALRSRRGCSNRLLSRVSIDPFEIILSAPLVLEYEDVALRQLDVLPYTADEIREIIDFLCRVGRPTAIFYLWRPCLRDPHDDLVLEAAVAGQADTIVTFNLRDFHGIERFGLQAQTPRTFLKEMHP